MNAKIPGETDEGIGVDVADNNGAVHEITIEKQSNEIVYHQCEAYADDPANRTDEENEHNNQARRFAQFYAYRERGHDTVDHIENPDYIEAVRQSIVSASDEAFNRFFGPLYQQLQSHHEAVDRLVALPDGVQKPDAVVYKLDTYLGVDIAGSNLTDKARALANVSLLDLEDGQKPTTGAAVTDEDIDAWATVGDHLQNIAEPTEIELELSATSGIHIGFPNARGEHEVEWADQPLNRAPDARLELLPADPGTLDAFREYLDHHLRCQIRDCFVGMGLMPPEPYRVVGFGKFIYARRYDHYELYPQLHLRDGDHRAVIS